MEALKQRIQRDGKIRGNNEVLKVDSFLKYIGSSTCLQLREVHADELCGLIDKCLSGALDEEVRRNAKLLREREHENVRGAAVLLGIENEKEEAAE